MWVFVLFDLPVKTKPQRKIASGFRKALLEDGFWMLQFSVYARPCPTQEIAGVHFERMRSLLPREGHVRMIQITDKQFARMQSFHAGKRARLEAPPGQLTLFS